MELWIRSQNKKKLHNIKHLELDNDETGIFNADTYTLLGKYNSKERALEVLDEIQNILKPIINCEPITREVTRPTDHYKKYECVEYLQTIQELSTYVYEMPLN